MSGIKVLVLTRYDRSGASSRVRILQYLPFCREKNIDFRVSPLLSGQYLGEIYDTGKKNYREVLWGYVRRLLILVRFDNYDVVWIEKELWPFCPAWLEKLFIGRCPRVILDYDDAVFLNYSDHPLGVVRWVLGKKIENLIKSVDVVTVGNNWLRDFAIRCGCQDVRYLPSVVDTDKYYVTSHARNNTFRVGWIGSPATKKYLLSLSNVLQELAVEPGTGVFVIGLESLDIPGVEIETAAWTEESEADDLHNMDLGVMPLSRTEWEKGKCGYKIIQYMASGLPVVATRIGANIEIIDDGTDGFLADNDEEWIAAIRQLIADDALYREMSRLAREKVEKNYSLQSRLDSFLSLFQY